MLDLNADWRLRGYEPGDGALAEACCPDFDDSEWLPVAVPGDVHSALIAAGKLPEPFDDMNIEKCQWVEDKEWWYRLSFECPADLTGDAELVFDGLDTYATIWLNGVEVGHAANQLITHVIEPGDALKPGETNTIAVRFDSTIKTIEQKPADHLWSAFNPHRPWVRKAGMNFGWDWGPRVVTAGIWRPVRLQAKKSPRIGSPYVRCHAISPQGAVVVVGCEIEGVAPDGAVLKVALDHDGTTYESTAQLVAERAETRMIVPDPKLWWPHSHGDQPLHNVTFTLESDAVLDEATVRTGLRTTEVVQAPDAGGKGKSFTLNVNGVPIFCKGADWIPVDNLIGPTPPERYRALVQMSKDANMNMLRIWGGGVYEHDEFYDACDELGVLVWQDFMFGCAAYPDDDPEIRDLIEVEADSVVRRLRNRPSIALWCGNNENDWLDDLMHGEDQGAPFYGRRIYHEILPAVCARLDPTRLYWPSSPYGGNDHNSEYEGDRHNWQVWGGQAYPRRFGEKGGGNPTPEGVSYRHYAECQSRFCSEFGIHGSPTLSTLTRHITEGELEYDSEMFLYRIKDPDKSRKDRMMTAHVGLPTDLADYAVKSALVQAEGLRFGLEHYRRNWPHCGGALFWQLHDCWPGISWSCIDYYLNPKASYYFVRRALAPTILSPIIKGSEVQLWGVNDELARWDGEALIQQVSLDGAVVDQISIEVNLDANASTHLGSWRLGLFGALTGDEPGALVITAPGYPEVPPNIVFPRELKDIPLKPAAIGAEWNDLGGNEYEVSLVSDVLAYFVHLVFPVDGIVASDNYVPVLPGEPSAIRFTSPEPLSIDQIEIGALNALR